VSTDADSGETDTNAALDRLANDLEAVASALTRLEAGTYWSDEISGEPIDDSVLAADPTARRNP
jgi:RNA polymerase-binding transcription factor DksA